MKAKDLYFIIGLTILFLLSAAFAINKVAGNGPNISETRQLQSFERIFIQNSINVQLYQSQEYKVIIDAPEDIIANIETIIKGNELLIQTNPLLEGANWLNHKGVTVSIYSPIISGIKLHGSSNISNKTPLSTDIINIDVAGSGNVKLSTLTANSVKVNVAGSGNVCLVGACDQQDLILMGSGDIHNVGLVCNSSSIKVNGSGSANVMCIDYLRAKIIGSGDINYKGDPITECSIAGSGKLHSI